MLKKKNKEYETAILYGYKSGWGPLYERFNTSSIKDSFVINDSNFKLNIVNQINEYKSVGFGDNITTALTHAMNVLRPRLVSSVEFMTQLNILTDMFMGKINTSWNKGSIVFPFIENMKSNLWVILLMFHALEVRCKSKSQWIHLRSRLWLWDGEGTSHSLLKPIQVFITDDCIYSGMQMRDIVYYGYNLLGTSEMLVAPVYATSRGIGNALMVNNNDKNKNISFFASYILPNSTPQMANELFNSDIAFCIRSKGVDGKWIVKTLYQLLNILNYRIADKEAYKRNVAYSFVTSSTSFSGKRLLVDTKLIGITTVAFAHKIPDELSTPTNWFVVGETIKSFINKLCMQSICKSDATDLTITTVKFKDLVNVLDTSDTKHHVNVGANINVNNIRKGDENNDGYFFDDYMLFDNETIHHAMKLSRSSSKSSFNFAKMSMFAPLIDAKLCGEDIASTQTRANHGDFTELVKSSNGHGTCTTNPKYKTVLRRHLMGSLDLRQSK